MTMICYMIHTGGLDRLYTMNDIELKIIQLFTVLLFILFFSSFVFFIYTSVVGCFFLFLFGWFCSFFWGGREGGFF